MDIKQLIGKTTDYDKKIALERKNNQVFIGGLNCPLCQGHFELV